MKSPVIPVAAMAAALLLTGCGTTRIGRIISDPSRYQSRGVTVEGRVTNVVGALNTGIYQVQDETGSIFVLSNRGVPNRETRVQVKGRVQQGVNVMGRSYGTLIRESDHKVRF